MWYNIAHMTSPESKSQKSEKGPENPGRRKFLGALGAATGLAAGLGMSRSTEAAPGKVGGVPSIEEGTLGYFLFNGFDKTADERTRAELSAQIMSQNTTIELEKQLLEKFDTDDIKDLNSGVIPRAVGTHSANFRKAMVGAGAAIAAGAAVGVASGYGKEPARDRGPNAQNEIGITESQMSFYKAMLGTVVGGMVAGGIMLNQPEIKNIDAAEKSVLNWIVQTKEIGDTVSKESIEERVRDLTDLQKKNSSMILVKR